MRLSLLRHHVEKKISFKRIMHKFKETNKSFIIHSWTKWERWMNIKLYLFVSGVNRGNEKRWVQDSLVLPHGFGNFPTFFFASEVAQFSAYGFCGWLGQWWLVFNLLEADDGYLLDIDATLRGGCEIWE